MKKNGRIKKGLKAALSMVLCVIMLCSSFYCVEPGMLDVDLSVKADAATFEPTTIGRIKQEQVVGINSSIDGIAARDFWYNVYANGYFDGHSMPTDIVIPGLGASSNYTPQGMTYWEAKNWILISAYDAGGSQASCIYAIDVDSGKFVALFNIYNADGTVNTSHGGGIAASKHNFYFADSASNISYVPLSEFNVAEGTEKNITLQGTVSFSGEMNTAKTSYCCYDDGVLWAGNFYYSGDDRYSTAANAAHKSMLMGYKLFGDSSQEEWDYLCGKYTNLLNVTTASASQTTSGSTINWAAYKNGSSVDITGDISAPTAYVREFCPTFGSVELTEGKTYVFQYVTNVDPSLNDFYIFAPNGKHTNIRQATDSVITQLDDGRWHVALEFTAGVQPSGADSSWSAGTAGTFTGTYSVRFDQDAIQAGESRNFAFTGVSITEANPNVPIESVADKINTVDRIHFAGTAGYPTYVVAFPDTFTSKIKIGGDVGVGSTINFDKIQYAMVDNGRIYVSRSWSRIIESTNYTSEIDVIDIDLDVPGTASLTINGATRSDCYLVDGASIHQFHNLSMGEALCVIDDYLYMFTESAAYNYRQSDWDANKDSDNGPTNVASQPVDVVWKIDQYAMMGEDRLSSDNGAEVATYEKITNIDEIKYTDEYMIVYQSEMKDSNGQKIMYALDSYGGFKDGLVPKNNAGTQKNTADSVGIVGHQISRYNTTTDLETDIETLTLYSPQQDDLASTRWKIIGAGTGSMRLENQDTYFGLYKNLYFGSRLMYMMQSEGGTSKLDHINIKDNGDGTFSFYYKGDSDYYLWCNDGSVQKYMDAYTAQYGSVYAFGGDNPHTADVETNTGVKAYAGQVELPGTFHSDANLLKTGKDTGNLTGEIIPEKYTKFSIYRRADDINISGKSGLYTNMDAELQSDGTYTLTLESYSTGQTVTKTTTEGKPIDFVFVLDTSASMQNNSDIAYYGVSDNPEPYDYEWGVDGDGNRKLKYNDTYYGVWGKRSNRQSSGSILNGNYKTWYHHTINLYDGTQDHYVGLNSEFYPIGSSNQNTMCLNYGFKKNSDKSFAGGYYWTNRKGDATRLEAMKRSTIEFIKQISEHAEKTGIQHRIAIVQYGSTSSIDLNQYADEGYYNTGMYSTSTGVTMKNYGDLKNSGFGQNNAVYENAFFPATHDNLEEIVNNISVTADSDTFVGHGMTMAMNVVADQMVDFNQNGDKVGERIYGTYSKAGETKYTEDDVNATACVINITDGAPGYGGSDEDAAYHASIEALERANTMKLYDVDIYSVQMGSDTVGSFSNTDFLDALSSNYINSSSTSKYEGNPNVLNKGTANGSGYYFSYDLSGTMDLNGFFDSLWSSTSSDTLLGTESVTLNSSSVLQHKLGDMFMLTDASTATAKTADIYYDSLGVMHEEAPVNSLLTPTKDVANNKVKLTGFDYSKKYLADGNAGQKLYLTIENVLLNPNSTSSDFGINNQENTAIYADSNAVLNNVQTQGFPQVNFTVPEYSYVSDFGLNMKTQNFIGTPVSVDYLPDKQETYATSITGDGKMDISINGTTANECALNLAIKPTCNSVATGYTLVKRLDGGYYWSKLNVVPASNVYYEEDQIVNSGTSGKIEWDVEGTTDGVYRGLPGEGDPYGYDEHYDDASQQFSNNSYLKVDVTSEKGYTTSKKKSFTFTGTGFDLMSACGTNTGVLAVGVKKFDEATQKLKTVKAFMVDTYYNDANVSSLISQVPVVKWEGAYGTYTVDVSAIYVENAGGVPPRSVAKNNLIDTGLVMNSAEPTDSADIAAILESVGMEDMIADDMELVWFDDNSIFNGGTGVAPTKKATRSNETDETAETVTLENYIDGFRVYNPLGIDEAAYASYEDSEKNAKYVNVLDNLMNKSGNVGTFGYIIGGQNDELTWANYETVGPQGEVYLNKGESINFTVTVDQAEKVMLGLRAVNGPTSVTIAANETYKVENVPINSATEMYYDITKCFGGVTADNQLINITITNADKGILAVNHVKHSGGDGSVGSGIVTRTSARSADATQAQDLLFTPFTEANLVDVQNSMNLPGVQGIVKNGVIIPLVEEEDETPDDTTTPDVPGDDTNNGNNDDTNTDSEEKEEFSIFSLLELLITLIEKILYNAFGAGRIA